MANPIRIILADAHDVVRRVLISMASEQTDVEVVGEASTGADALELVRRLAPDVLVVDFTIPGMAGGELIDQIRAECPQVHVIAFSGFLTPQASAIIPRVGVAAHISKHSPWETLFAAIRRCARPEPR
jgi:DNA-binding NarL/FixJ family response regulator